MDDHASGEKTKLHTPLDIEFQEKRQIASLSDTSDHEGISRKLMHLSSEDCLKLGNGSLLQRVHFLDNILSTMEDKVHEPHLRSLKTTRGHSSAPSTPSGLETRCKPAEFVLEEVEEKGTLVERVSELENRVFKLQRILSATSSLHDQAVVPEPQAVAMAHVPSAHSTPPHDQVIDVEVVTHSEFAVFEIDPRKEEIKKRGGSEEMSSSEGASASDERIDKRHWKNKSTKLKKWLSKRLHMHLPGTTRRQKSHCVPHCWNPHLHKESCWNIKRGDPHPGYEDIHNEHDGSDECP